MYIKHMVSEILILFESGGNIECKLLNIIKFHFTNLKQRLEQVTSMLCLSTSGDLDHV